MGVSLINPVATAEEATINDIESHPFTESIPVVIGLLFPSHHPQSRLVSGFAQCAREVMLEKLSPLCE